jgi:hypothetical protein
MGLDAMNRHTILQRTGDFAGAAILALTLYALMVLGHGAGL